jgi:hypothetical protein
MTRRKSKKTTNEKFGPSNIKCSVCTAEAKEPFPKRAERLQDFALSLADDAEKYNIIVMAMYFPRRQR